MKYRKKPVVIEAIRYTGDNKGEIFEFTNKEIINVVSNTGYEHLTVFTLEGNHKADIGDWIIKGVKGEFYPCKPDIFEMTYDVLEKTD